MAHLSSDDDDDAVARASGGSSAGVDAIRAGLIGDDDLPLARKSSSSGSLRGAAHHSHHHSNGASHLHADETARRLRHARKSGGGGVGVGAGAVDASDASTPRGGASTSTSNNNGRSSTPRSSFMSRSRASKLSQGGGVGAAAGKRDLTDEQPQQRRGASNERGTHGSSSSWGESPGGVVDDSIDGFVLRELARDLNKLERKRTDRVRGKQRRAGPCTLFLFPAQPLGRSAQIPLKSSHLMTQRLSSKAKVKLKLSRKNN